MEDIPAMKRGRLILYRLYDVSDEIKLSLVESRIEESFRMRLSRHPYMKALEFTDPPVSFVLTGFSMNLFGGDVSVHVGAKAFDFGVISLAFNISIPAGTAFSDLERIAKALDGDQDIDERAGKYIRSLVSELGNAVVQSSIKEDYTEDYTIILIEELEGGMHPEEFLEGYDPSRLLLFETRELSRQAREDAMKYRFSYYPDDLVIINYDSALVIEPSGSTDILDMLEFANAQILELRYYDHVLDRQISWIYSELSRRGAVSTFRLRDYERLGKKVTEIIAELTEVTEKVDNALKVTEDVYYAKIYRTAMMMFRSQDWETSIKEKLHVVTDTARMIYDEISTKRGHFLEIGIIILIAIEIVLILIIEW